MGEGVCLLSLCQWEIEGIGMGKEREDGRREKGSMGSGNFPG